MIRPRLLALARTCRATRRGGPCRRRGVEYPRPSQLPIADENPQLTVKLLADHHAIARLHVLGGRTRQLQKAVVPAHGPVGLHHAIFLERKHSQHMLVRHDPVQVGRLGRLPAELLVE